MTAWYKHIQEIINIIDVCIKNENDEALTLRALSEQLGYSDYYTSRKFSEISGMTLKDYLRYRRLAFALRDVRDTTSNIMDIAVKYGFSSNEAFTRAFKAIYGVSPSEFRANPRPVILRTIIKPFDCYLMEGAMKDMKQKRSNGEVAYFLCIFYFGNSKSIHIYFRSIKLF